MIAIGNADGMVAGHRGQIPLGDAYSDDEDDDDDKPSKSQQKSLCQKRSVIGRLLGSNFQGVLGVCCGASAWKKRIQDIHVEDF